MVLFLLILYVILTAVNVQELRENNRVGLFGSIEYTKKIQAEYYQHPPLEQFQKPLIIDNRTSLEAYAYMFCSRGEIDGTDRMYYQALLFNIHKLRIQMEALHSKPRDIIILICSYTPRWQITEISNFGALAIVVDPIIPDGYLSFTVHYLDQFTKFHLFRLTGWERILYLDIDTNIQKDAFLIWDEASTQIIKKPPQSREKSIDDKATSYNRDSLYPYLMTAVLDWACLGKDPKDCDPYFIDYFNAGVFMIMPSMDHFNMLIAEMNKAIDPRSLMEQDLMNRVYRSSGELPWRSMPNMYNHRPDSRVRIAILHEKFWNNGFGASSDPWGLAKGFTWHSELQNFLYNKTTRIEHLYYPDDIIFLGSQKPLREAYVFVVENEIFSEDENFINHRNLMVAIKRLRMMDDKRDFVVIVSESTPESQRKELGDIDVFVIRVKSFSSEKNMTTFSKLYLWKLIHWSRILYIDRDLNIMNLNVFLDIWKDPQAKVQLHKEAQLLFAAPRNNSDPSDSHFGLQLFMFQPSIEGFDKFMHNLQELKFSTEYELLNDHYNKPLPVFIWTILNSSYASLETTKPDMRTYFGKLWNQRDIYNNDTIKRKLVQEYWTIFSNYTEASEPHCKLYPDFEQQRSFFYAPRKVSEEGMSACSEDCEKCFRNNTCYSCRSNDATCVLIYSNNTDHNGVLAYCSVCDGYKCKYLTRGHIEYDLLYPRIILLVIGLISIVVATVSIYWMKRYVIQIIKIKLYRRRSKYTELS